MGGLVVLKWVEDLKKMVVERRCCEKGDDNEKRS